MSQLSALCLSKWNKVRPYFQQTELIVLSSRAATNWRTNDYSTYYYHKELMSRKQMANSPKEFTNNEKLFANNQKEFVNTLKGYANEKIQPKKSSKEMSS